MIFLIRRATPGSRALMCRYLPFFLLLKEPVTHAGLGQNMLRPVRVRLDLVPYIAYGHPEKVKRVVGLVVFPPYFLQYLFVGQYNI